MERQEITFTLKWDITKHKTKMKEIRRQITLLLQCAQTDFSLVTESIRQCSTMDLHPAIASRISDVTRFLQYMDTLTQKLNHIILINQALMDAKVMRTTSDDCFLNMDSAAFLFRVNYFQARMAQREFLSTTHTLEHIIEEIVRADAIRSMRTPCLSEAFSNLKKGEANMDFLLRALHIIYTERSEEHHPVVCPSTDVEKITGLYTMNSERLILDWLLTHADNNVDELLQVYACNEFDQMEEQTELF